MSKTNFYYAVEIDYDRTSCTGRCDTYCRCSKIINAVVTSVNIERCVEMLSNNNDSEIIIYGIERILRHLKIYDVNNYNITISQGYYGEEIGNVFWDKDVRAKQLIEEFRDSQNKIEHLLTLEYYKVLPQLLNKIWYIETVNCKDVELRADHHVAMIKRDSNDYYKDYDGVKAVCLKEGCKFRVYDGYHRILQNTNENIKILVGV